MQNQILPIPEVDEARIKIILDNSIDLLIPSTDIAKRFPLGANPFESPLPIAEHGFSALIEVKRADDQATILFDTGLSQNGLLHNMDALEINAEDLQGIILSHGHPDHAMGLPGLVKRLGLHSLPLVLHPDSYLQRKLVLPDGHEINLPAPNPADFRRENIEIIEEVGPSMLVDDMVLISGEVARTSGFEKGFPIHHARRNDLWEPDPLIMDDQCAILNLRDKGLVILTGCGHAGIINTIRYAQTLTGIQEVYAVIGGFHLSGQTFEPIIPATVSALKEIKPRYMMPGHCTGWSALQQIANNMPESFIPSSVGTTLIL